MSPTESFKELFGSINMLTVCLWITGFILFCIEFFQPMHGVAYSLGLGLLGAAFISRMIYGSAGEAFMFVMLTCVLLFCVHIVSIATQKRDWLKVARIERAGARRRRYNALIDSVGVANTPIDLTGNATINDINLVVYSETPIKQGERVRITEITPDKIIVERVAQADSEA
ncbi:MAG: hypothetical protein K2O94_08285 [Clostridiales bacterium]|nr:hypothetical protein [Clostridiales bacterium]